LPETSARDETEHLGADTLVVSPAALPVHVLPEQETERDAFTPAVLAR
jgi:hypothetical protein